MDSAFRTVARLLHRGLIAPSGALATDDLTSPQLADYAHALHAWNPDVVEESDYQGRKRAELTAFLKRYAAAPELINHVRSIDPSMTIERIAAALQVPKDEAPAKKALDVDATAPQFRTVARMFRRGHIAPDGALMSNDITSPQLVDYAKALREWNPDVVEESDYTGRSRAELLAFLRRYAAVPTLVNKVRSANPDGSLERVVSHLSGNHRPQSHQQSHQQSLDHFVEETKQAEQAEAARIAREEQLNVLDEQRREALDKHREVRTKREALRKQVQEILVLQIRRRNVEAELERASARVAALAEDLMGPANADAYANADAFSSMSTEAVHECDAMEGHVNGLLSELNAIHVDEERLPEGDLDDIVAGLVSEGHYLAEEQTLLQDRVTKANLAIIMGGGEVK